MYVFYFRFPNDPYLKKVWTKAAGRSADWVPKPNSAICSKHFEPFLFVQRKTGSRTYIRDRAVPTLNLPVHVSIYRIRRKQCKEELDYSPRLWQTLSMSVDFTETPLVKLRGLSTVATMYWRQSKRGDCLPFSASHKPFLLFAISGPARLS